MKPPSLALSVVLLWSKGPRKGTGHHTRALRYGSWVQPWSWLLRKALTSSTKAPQELHICDLKPGPELSSPSAQLWHFPMCRRGSHHGLGWPILVTLSASACCSMLSTYQLSTPLMFPAPPPTLGPLEAESGPASPSPQGLRTTGRHSRWAPARCRAPRCHWWHRRAARSAAASPPHGSTCRSGHRC